LDFAVGNRLAYGSVSACIVGALVLSGLVYSTLGSSSPSPTTSTAQTSPAYSDLRSVEDRANQYVGYIEAKDATALGGFYSFDAKINWTGVFEPWTGHWGSDVAAQVMSRFFGTGGYSANVTSPVVTPTGPQTVGITFRISMRVTDAVFGPTTASILVSQDWFNYGGNWLINAETWDFTLWSIQGPQPA